MSNTFLKSDQAGTGGGCSSGGCSSGGCGTSKGEPKDAVKPLVQLNVGLAKAESGRPTIAERPFAGTEKYPQGLLIGLDVGSTTVKFVVVNPLTDEILHKDYQRHDTKQPEKCIEMLRVIEQKFADVPNNAFRVFMTGSGGSSIGKRIGAKFVQEVNAVSLAVEKLYPQVQSVVELGGQDAKIIIFKPDEETGKKKKIPSMNDKCAGGTGAVIDKINAKLRIPAEQLCQMGYRNLKLHPVAGKCGVFAETDINGLQKQGVPADELMASLFESIIQQNLAVLTRGHTLRPVVLLLGGPNTYIKGMVECWRHNIPIIWQERNVTVPDRPIEELIVVPENAQYFAAIGAVEFAKIEVQDHPDFGVYRGVDELAWYVNFGRVEEKKAKGSSGLVKNADERAAFADRYRKEPWDPAKYAPGTHVRAFLGIDGGSTSTKAVLMDLDKKVIARAYQLSKGNPIEDTIEICTQVERQILDQGCTLEVLGVGTTGYAKDILRDVIGADVALVETVAHTQAGLHYYPDTDVICDVGGQDIKLIILKNGQVKDFKLNTQCSAGNGYFLQSTAQGFGFKVEEFADIAFSAQAMPQFGYGCAVFMQSDIVDFQRQGWSPEEIMAGLCDVLPKNIWLYVSQIPNLAKLGRTFVLQGGTQNNLAAVKSQVDFITSRFRGTGVEPRVIVHKFCGEAGAIGCAVEAHRLYTEQSLETVFIGFERVRQIEFRTTRNENTRCYFCKNKCLRTFIDVKTGAEQPAAAGGVRVDLSSHIVKTGPEAGHPTRIKHGGEVLEPAGAAADPPGDANGAGAPPSPTKSKSKVPLATDEQRLIIATCEKGTVEDVNDMREIKKGLDAVKKANPNFAEIAAREAFGPTGVAVVADPLPRVTLGNVLKRKQIEARIARMQARETLRIGLPRVLNMYSMAPWFTAYFQSLGIPHRNLVWSDYTSEELYKEGAKRGAIDPCFPSKVGIPHVHNLLYHKHAEKPLDCIFFPMIDALPTFMHGVLASRACPTVAATPEAVKAAFTKESDLFAEKGVVYLDTFLNFDEPALLERQMFGEWGERLGLTAEENARACRAAWAHDEQFWAGLQRDAREVLDKLEREDGIGVVLLTRPYHHDPGVCHEIPDELQKLGFPVFTMDTLPRDAELLERLFGDEVRRGEFAHALSIEDAWKNAYSENTNRKVWAAKYAARHANLVALELSSFKCGHDAPIYSIIEEIIETSETPYFCFKDIDENKPTGSIKIRIETIAYFLRRHREKLVARRAKLAEVEAKLAAFEAGLVERARAGSLPAAQGVALCREAVAV
ncbi:MAG: BadF/BadG/BcrA/BcrD ATPase family protein [Phycisphaerae bacterium]